MGAYSYQFYHNYQNDKYIDETLKSHNRSVNRYVEINNEARAENEGLKHDLIHWQAMYEASKSNCEMLEEQVDVVSEYWKKEYVKINDELFDLKHKKVETLVETEK
jgi:hypothetical protein